MLFTTYGFTGNRYSAEVNPDSGRKITDIKLLNSIIDHIQMLNSPDLAYDDEWTFNTVFMAEFLNNLLAGNLTYSISEIEKIRIKRRKRDSFTWLTLREYPCNDESDLNFILNDVTNRSGVEYEYALVPVTSGDIEGNYSTASILSTFNGIYLVEDNILYSADLNASLSTTRNFTTAVHPTLGKQYPFVHKIGKSNYITGQMEATFVHMDNVNCEMDFSNGIVYREQVADFLTNGNPKIIKYHDGRIYLAGITGQINETNENWLAPIWSFEFTCVGDAENEDDLYNAGFVTKI